MHGTRISIVYILEILQGGLLRHGLSQQHLIDP